MSAFVKLTGNELKLFLREPVAAFFSVLFPSALVVILGSVKPFRAPIAAFGGSRVIDLYVPIALLLTVAMLGLQVTPQTLAGYREKGILRRLETTPVPPSALLGAQLVSSLLAGIISMALVLTIGRLAFSVALPKQFLGYCLSLLLVAAATAAIGIFVAAVVSTAKTGNAIGTVLFFPMMFFAGLWVPRESMPTALRDIAEFTPLGAAEHALRTASTGSFPHPAQLGVLAAYIVVFGLAAARMFRWE